MTRKVITYGTFDLFHIGHIRLLERLAALGDHLTVCVSTDEFNAVKGKTAVMSWEQRAALVGACRYVDRVLPEKGWGQKREDILREKIDVFAMGDDWEGKFDDLKDLCEVVYLPRTKDVSSTSLKTAIRGMPPPDAAPETAVGPDTLTAILGAARQGEIGRKAYDGFYELLTRHEDKSDPDWLRAWILLHCLAKKRAFKTQGYISKYNRISRRKKKTAEYADFMALLFGEMGLLRPIGGKFSASFGAENIREILEQCRTIAEGLAGYGREIFANSGTLLGLVREGTLLAHDNDIDLGILLQAGDAAGAAREWIALTDRMIAEGVAVQRSSWSQVTLKLHKIGGFGVDLFPAWCGADDRLWIYPHTAGNLTKAQLLPLKSDPMTGLGLPRDAEAVLVSNYGKDWRTPDEGWSFDWPASRKSFADFLAHITGPGGPAEAEG